MNFKEYKNAVSPAEAMKSAKQSVGVGEHEEMESSISCREGLYEIRLRTSFMSYELYIDAESGELLGFDSTPTEPARWYEAPQRAA